MSQALLEPVTLGCEQATAYLYDRGGTQRLYEFPRQAVASLDFERALSKTSTANLAVSADLCDCVWLGRIRSVRHELVIFRGSERVWEGPVVRVAYTPTRVVLVAKDVSWWLGRRAIGMYTLARRFETANAVTIAQQLVSDAFRYDDPNVRRFVTAIPAKGAETVAAYNPTDAYYLDALDDMVDSGVQWTVMGRRIVLWSGVNRIAQTNMMRTPQDLEAEVTVIEDGLSLATSVIATGGDTWGRALNANGSGLTPTVSAQEPEVINFASNPSLRINSAGFNGYTSRFYVVTRVTTPAWPGSIGGAYGKLSIKLPAAKTDARRDFDDYEMVMTMYDQRVPVQKGQKVCATLVVRGTGPDQAPLTLCLRTVDINGVRSDRPFAEGPPILPSTTDDRLLFVEGVVPEDAVRCWVEVARETTEVPWKNAADGFWFDKFGLWDARLESWFDGDSTDTAETQYQWLSSPGQSQSVRRWFNTNPPANPTYPAVSQWQERVSTYYGIVEEIMDSRATTRLGLETDAKAMLMQTFPAPLAIDIPQSAPLRPGAPVTFKELMAGTVMPLQSAATCRQVGALPVLQTMKAAYTPQGERVTVTLATSQAWEIDPPDDPDAPGGTDDDDDNAVTP